MTLKIILSSTERSNVYNQLILLREKNEGEKNKATGGICDEIMSWRY